MNTSERASHPSRAQIESLLEFLQRNPSLAKGFSKVPSARVASRRSWEALALQLNNLGGCVKTSKQWIKYWADKKSAVKKKSALRYRARNKTGVGAEVVELNDVEETILSLMGGESFGTGDRHLEINPFETSASTSQTVEQASEELSISLLGSQLLEIDAPLPQTGDHQFHRSTQSTLSDIVICTRNQSTVTPSPPHTPPAGISGPPPLPTTPSGSGAHPSRRTLNAQHWLLGSPAQNQPPSPLTTPSNRHGRQRRQTVAPPTQRLSQFSRMTERFLAIEEQRIEVDRRNSLLFEAIVNHARERDTATSQALQAIGEGLKLLAENLKK
ncbi:uncharacterized protein [Maniola hyperantus]|uniref:uncharacterized protein isoform X1 n=1 Tax=Aphantopus hyperantus TaxID=2795564 RepID=UPI0021347686